MREATNSYDNASSYGVTCHAPHWYWSYKRMGACQFYNRNTMIIPFKAPLNVHMSFTILWYMRFEYFPELEKSFFPLFEFHTRKNNTVDSVFHEFGFERIVANPEKNFFYIRLGMRSAKEYLVSYLSPRYLDTWKYLGFTFKRSNSAESDNYLTFWEDSIPKRVFRLCKNATLFDMNSLKISNFQGKMTCLQIYNTSLTKNDVLEASNACKEYQ